MHERMRNNHGSMFQEYLWFNLQEKKAMRDARAGGDAVFTGNTMVVWTNLKNDMLNRHREVVNNANGVDATAPPELRLLSSIDRTKLRRYYQERAAMADVGRIQALRELDIIRHPFHDFGDDDDTDDDEFAGPRPAPRAPAPPRGELARFAADGQNVHTKAMVDQTKKIITLVRKIPVPEEYRWNKATVSPTIGEIIAACKLTAHAAAQMFNKYVSYESIYDLEEGIYGKVLDSVWQYVKNSPDKEDLCKILKQEMQDNVGMCAQGNLTRICNILAGYLEGVSQSESLAERLGRIMPKFMEVEDQMKRVADAIAALKENGAPREEWDAWLFPLVEDDGFDLTAAIAAA
jgi:hypothetical protein